MVTSSIATLDAAASTPDEKISARIIGRDQVEVRLAPGYIHRVEASDLEFQLTRLAKLLFVSRMREYYRGRSRDFGQLVTKESPPANEQDRDFVERRSQLVAEGGIGSVVELTVVGMEHWSVQVDPQRLAELDEEGLCRAISRAASELVADQFDKVRGLKNEVYLS